MTRSRNKRTKDEASPGSATSQPGKIQIMSDKTPPAVPGGAVSTCTPPSSATGNSQESLTPTQQMFGQFFPPHLQYFLREPVTPVTPVTPTGIQPAQAVVASSVTQDQGSIQAIFDRLSSIDSRISKLDRIEKDVSKISQKCYACGGKNE